jgi:thioredoxin reductase (NADPH)
METFLSFLIAATLTLFFVRRYVRGLAASRSANAEAAAIPLSSLPCPRCAKPLPEGSAYCAACGAPMALWKVHRAAVQDSSGSGPSGKARPSINTTVCIGCGSCVHACPEAGTLAVVGGKSRLTRPDGCAGHGKCAEACPTQALTLAFGGVLQTMKVPQVSESFETNVPGLYIVGELGGKGLIKTAINEGRLAIDCIKNRLAGAPPPQGDALFDVIIVGAGPAGLSASLSAQQDNINYLTLEQGEIAATIRQYPRHKFLMAEPIQMPLYGNLYIADSTKESLLSVWETIIANTGVRIQTNTRVEDIRRADDIFHVETSQGRYSARCVLLAAGKRGTPRRLDVPGEDLPKVAYGLIEAESYAGCDILVVGGGDSAIEAAVGLSKDHRNRVTLSYRSDSFSRARERNQAHLAAAEQDGRIQIRRKSTVQEVRPQSVVLATDVAAVEIPNDYVFVLIGGESPEAFLRKIGVAIVEKAVGA